MHREERFSTCCGWPGGVVEQIDQLSCTIAVLAKRARPRRVHPCPPRVCTNSSRIDQECWSLRVCEPQAHACDLMLVATDAAFMPAQAIAAHHERDAPGSARTRLRGLAHLPDSLGPQIDLHLHSIWTAGRTAPEAPFLPTPMPRPVRPRFRRD